MISPVCTVNGKPTLDGVDVTPGEAVLIQLVSTAGVDVWTLQCIGTDETSDRDDVNANLVINTARKSAAFTPSGPGKAFMFQSIVNGKIAATFGVYTLATGNRVGAMNETTEGSAKFGWLTKFNKFLRGTISGGSSVPSGSGFWHITNGIGDGAAKLIDNDDIAPNAKIAASKVDFSFGLGLTTKAVTGGTVTLTPAEFSAQTIRLTGALTAAVVIVLPTIADYAKLIRNDTQGNFALTVKTAAGLGVVIPPEQARWVFCDGTNLLSGGAANGIVTMQTVATRSMTQAINTTYVDVAGLLLTFPIVVPGDKIVIQSAAQLSINTSGYSAYTIVAVVDGSTTVTIPESERKRSQSDIEGYQHSVSVYTVLNAGSLTVKQQLRTTVQNQAAFCNGGSSLVGTLIRP